MAKAKSDLVSGKSFSSVSDISVIIFVLGGKKYGASVSQIWEVIRMVEITEIPGTPKFVAGVINLRGKVIPIVDLRKYFKIPSTIYTLDNAILIAEIEGKTVGIVVDQVCDVLSISTSNIEQGEKDIAFSPEFIEGVARVGDGLLPLVNFNKILSFEEKRQLEDLASR